MLKTIKEFFIKKKKVKFEEYINNTDLSKRRFLKDSEIPPIAEIKPLFVIGKTKCRKYYINETYGIIYNNQIIEGFIVLPINYEQIIIF